MRVGVACFELRNNGGQFDCVVVALLLDQSVDVRGERRVVERVELRRGIEPLRFGFRSAVLSGCGGLPHEVKES